MNHNIIFSFLGENPHFSIYIDNVKINNYGSQGQHRTSVLSLKLAELQVIYDEIGEYPILLLDDFMSELDEKRISNFLNNGCK